MVNNMLHGKQNYNRSKALTLLEMVIALSIVSVLFAVILPVFTSSGKSWDARQSSSEAIQNGRVLVDYINRQLTQAVKIIAVSDSSEINGYIEFIDNDQVTQRFDIAANNYVQFGEITAQSELAGPVTKLQFTCYALDDMDTPITDVSLIRFVKVEAILDNASFSGKDKVFLTSAYLQTNGYTVSEAMVYTPFEFDTVKGETPALAKIDAEHYLCVYSGDKDNGWATVLTVNPLDWTISNASSFEFDSKKGKTPALSMIDSTHFLCAYEGDKDDGWATVLTVNPSDWTISNASSFEFDSKKGKTPALCKIDSTHFFCAYEGDKDDGWATVLTVDSSDWTISNTGSFEFDSNKGKTPALSKIDFAHFLCVYEGDENDGWSIILTVDTDTWEVSSETSFEFDLDKGKAPALSMIDSMNFLCSYEGNKDDGWSTILTVNLASWTISNGMPLEFDPTMGKTSALSQIDLTSYLCVYTGDKDDGWATVLTVNTANETIANDAPFEFDQKKAKESALVSISDSYFLCVYSGDADDGWAVVLAPGSGAGLSP